MKHIGLFEGIGGFSLAARWMGWETVAWCEWNEFGQKVLKHHFPEAEGFGDITKTDFKKYANKIDIHTGGFPCQPYSQAGKRKGKADERHLWPEMLRAIKEIQPRWVVGENVFGLVNWSNGLVFHEVQADLETAGYEVFPYVLPAAAINAPHRRDRVWFVAFKNTLRNGWGDFKWQKETEKWRFGNISPRDNERLQTNDAKNRFVAHANNTRANNESGINRNGEAKNKGWKEQPQFKHREDGSKRNAPHPDSDGQQRSNGQNEKQPSKRGEYAQRNPKPMGWNVADTDLARIHEQHNTSISTQKKQYGRSTFTRGDFSRFPTQPPICGGDDGLPRRLDNITFSKWRNESIKAYGNAIVPQVALQIFKTIEQYESL